ncbi:MAG: MFS transporter [Nocardioidaceae bacterium]
MSGQQLGRITTDIPARMDRLPWSRWHWLVVLGLGTVWILDGLEVTIVGSIAARLTEKGSGITITEAQIGVAAGVYVAGACLGALFFGYLADRIGRKKLFMITLAVYLVATVATAFSTTPMFFYACRFFTGAGIGGEYAAINSAIDELIPARVRGRVDLIINGSFWLGTAFGAALSVFLLNEAFFAKDLGWRLAFGLGAIFGLCILLVRRYVPESPRWMFIHGKEGEAEELVQDIEAKVEDSTDERLEGVDKDITVRQRKSIGFGEIAKTMVTRYPKRSVLGLSLFIGQAFLYNAVFFTFALVLTKILKVEAGVAPWYLIPLAIGNFLGPLVLGRFFDTVGRKVMISLTYVLSGLLLVLTGVLFHNGSLTATTLTAMWCLVFFFASAGASAAYLTVSEIFPMETRAMAIAFFYAIGTGLGGIVGPIYFGKLIEEGRNGIVRGYYIGATLMILAGLVEIFLGVAAQQRSLEDIATPLTAEETERDDSEEGSSRRVYH